MTYGLVFSAGKETRFDDKKPKTLSMIGDICLLDHQISCLKPFCDEVFVVCSVENECYFDKYNKIVISSGYGCGDAVWKALNKINMSYFTKVFITWGDCVVNCEVLKEMYYNCISGLYRNTVIIPCSYEKNPYVRIIPMSNGKVSVEFGKYNEVKGPGLHDFGVFLGYGIVIEKFLNDFHGNIYNNKTMTYIHKHNNEMQFLDVFNETEIKAHLLQIDGIPIQSFNTKEELKKIKL